MLLDYFITTTSSNKEYLLNKLKENNIYSFEEFISKRNNINNITEERKKIINVVIMGIIDGILSFLKNYLKNLEK